MNHIELFAGCGGLTLGLESAGFKTILANELSPMAAETYAFNFLKENLAALADNNAMPNRTLWLSSNHRILKPRLRENPLTYPVIEDENSHSDLPDNLLKLEKTMLVGSIVELNKLLNQTPEFGKLLQQSFGKGELDLVSGGPPCQSFSMAGMRKKDCDKNALPWEFATFISHVKPKIAMLENVTGILNAFKDEDGTQYHAWHEIAKVFASKGYIPICLHINAKYAGVAQNRPRFIMISIREDFYNTITKWTDAEQTLFSPSIRFYKKVQQNIESVVFGDIPYFDITKSEHAALFKNSFLSQLVSEKFITVKEAIDDLKIIAPAKPSLFVKQLNTHFSAVLGKTDKFSNHDQRANSDVVKRRFRLYQILQEINDRKVTKDAFEILKKGTKVLNDSSWLLLSKYEFLAKKGQLVQFSDKQDLIEYLLQHPTKKQTQKALIADAPAPAALSIPDDACHYDKNELRVLTVREMARIQSFPDQFEFRSKITTGGQNRKFEVPQYTQVGNAVPPLLAYKLGCVIKNLINLPHL